MGLILSALSPRLWLVLAIALVVGASALFANRAGHNAEQLKISKSELTAVRTNAATSNRQNATVIKAQNDQIQRTQSQAMAATAARFELDGLRSDIAALQRDLPIATNDARSSTAAAATELLAECSRNYQELALKADGHANDTLTLQSGWPK